MKILHALTQTELTGSEVFCKQLADQQQALGHELTFVSDEFHLDWSAYSQKLARYPLSKAGPFAKIKAFLFLRTLLKNQRPEIIHCHSRGASRHFALARVGLKIPMMTTLHGRPHFSWSKVFFKSSYGERITVVCENLKRELIVRYKYRDEDIDLIRNPLPDVFFNDEAPRLSSVSDTKKKIRLGWVGRSSGPKGDRFAQILENALLPCLEKHSEFELNVLCDVQDGSILSKTLKKAQQGFPNQIQVAKSAPVLLEWYQQCQWILGGGRVAMEGLSLGKKVFVVGEGEWLGELNQANFPKALASNFGDILTLDDSAEREKALDLAKIKDAFLEHLSHSHSNSKSELSVWLKSQVELEFKSGPICQHFEASMKKARFKHFVPNWIPILMYHKVPDAEIHSQHKIFIAAKRFQKHVRFFTFMNFETLTFQDLSLFWNGKKPFCLFPRRPLILTFDDGYRDNLKNAFPALKKARLKSVLFLLANHNTKENDWDELEPHASNALLTANDRQTLDLSWIEIGSHGSTHRSLPKLSDSEILTELVDSKTFLENEFGCQVLAFAPPFGHTDQRVQNRIEESGFSFAVNTDQGGMSFAPQPFGLFRVNVFPKDGYWALWKKTSAWYRQYFARKKQQR